MANVCVAFEVLNGMTSAQMREGKVKLGFKHVGTHMIFDINIDSKVIRKVRLVEGGHKITPPLYINYYSFMTRESVILAFIIAGMKDLDTCACNIVNAYLNATCREKPRNKAGSEFGSDKGYVLIIIIAHYGLKSSGGNWRENIA